MKTAILIFFMIASVGAAPLALNSTSRVRDFAGLPNWPGIWQNTAWLVDESGRPPGGSARVQADAQLLRSPPYNPAWAAKYEAAMRDKASLAARSAVSKICRRTFPGIMEGPRTFQVVILPEETLLVFESGQVRHIYTDGRAHPKADDVWETSLGDSIGHWEQDIFMVDTIARRSSEPVTAMAWASLLSEQAHFTERFRMVDADTLENELKIDDPVAFSRPWLVTLTYKRLRNLDRMIPYDCDENDRNPVIGDRIRIAKP